MHKVTMARWLLVVLKNRRGDDRTVILTTIWEQFDPGLPPYSMKRTTARVVASWRCRQKGNLRWRRKVLRLTAPRGHGDVSKALNRRHNEVLSWGRRGYRGFTFWLKRPMFGSLYLLYLALWTGTIPLRGVNVGFHFIYLVILLFPPECVLMDECVTLMWWTSCALQRRTAATRVAFCTSHNPSGMIVWLAASSTR